MDDIQDLRQKITNSAPVWCDERGRPVRFSSSFLNDVAQVFELHGFGVTQAYLIEKSERRELRPQAASVLKVLELLSLCPQIQARRSIGRLILKSLPTLAPKGGNPRD